MFFRVSSCDIFFVFPVFPPSTKKLVARNDVWGGGRIQRSEMALESTQEYGAGIEMRIERLGFPEEAEAFQSQSKQERLANRIGANNCSCFNLCRLHK